MPLMKRAYGGVVINSRGQVLLREPAGHYKGDVWTFAKGRPDPGESPEQTALREVLEETGYRTEIIGKIPGSFDGKRTSNEYFLLLPVEDTKQFDAETESIRWATGEEARRLIKLNRKSKRRRRDLRVLKMALALFHSSEAAIHSCPSPGHGSAVWGGISHPMGEAV
jgi:8-oxo-dGTP pyrophosphatase MutT (NUDIX family)